MSLEPTLDAHLFMNPVNNCWLSILPLQVAFKSKSGYKKHYLRIHNKNILNKDIFLKLKKPTENIRHPICSMFIC